MFIQLSMNSDDEMNPNQLPDPFSFPIEPKFKDCKAVIRFLDIEKAKIIIRQLLSNKYVRFIAPLKWNSSMTETEEVRTIKQLVEENTDKWEYHQVDNIVGSEADFVVNYCCSEMALSPVLSRARKLLIIIMDNLTGSPDLTNVLEEAVTKGLVTNGDELVQM